MASPPTAIVPLPVVIPERRIPLAAERVPTPVISDSHVAPTIIGSVRCAVDCDVPIDRYVIAIAKFIPVVKTINVGVPSAVHRDVPFAIRVEISGPVHRDIPSRVTAKFLLRSTEAFRSRAVAAVVDADRAAGVFAATSRRACYLCEFRSRIRSFLARFRSRTARSPVSRLARGI